MMDWEDRVGGERTTRASTASSLKLRRANARRPLTHSKGHEPANTYYGPASAGAGVRAIPYQAEAPFFTAANMLVQIGCQASAF